MSRGVLAVYVEGRNGSIEILSFLPKEKVRDLVLLLYF